ncbi:MAG: SPOR domain-containing protein [Pseudomonadota bacterium]|nr:SPOR domain-containing protein [Pseudomonadota bacterium]
MQEPKRTLGPLQQGPSQHSPLQQPGSPYVGPRAPHPAGANQLPLSRNHLYALGTLSVALAVLSFFVGFQAGRGQVVAPSAPAVARFVPDEVAAGDLEVLLAGVEQANVGEAPLGFPAELPRTDMALVAPPALGEGGVLVPVVAPPPPPNPFPAEARPGLVEVGADAPTVAPSKGDIPTSGWSIQVAEQPLEEDALRQVETLQAAGLSAYKVVALVNGASVWRIRIGGYSSKDTATAALAGVSSKAGAAGATVTRAP